METFFTILEMIGVGLFVVFFLGFAIFIHELGHFLAARWRGLHVVAFSIGFKKAWGKKINGVEYRIGWLPFGGYVDIPQIDATSTPKLEDGKELERGKPIDRIITAFCGPLFNILFGLLLGCVVWAVGIPQATPKMREIVVGTIDHAGPEYQAGLRVDDKIYRINGDRFFCTWNKFVQKILFSVGEVSFEVDRKGNKFEVKFVPKENPNAPKDLKFEKVAWPFFTPKIPIVLYPNPGSPAAIAGIKSGDILIEINNIHIADFFQFAYQIDLSDGKPVTLLVDRKGEKVKISNIIPVINTNIPKEAQNRYLVGIVYSARKIPLEILTVAPGGTAAKAGIMPKDELLALDGVKITDAKTFISSLKKLKNKPFELELKRGDKMLKIKLAAKLVKYYSIGVRLTVKDHPTPFQQLTYTVDISYKSLRGIIFGLANKLGLTQSGSTLKPRNLSGPLGMVKTVFQSVYYGSLMYGIFFVVIISFALAIFNLLPLPVLDGGHMLLAVLELVFRRPLHEGTIRVITFVFVVLLISLMVYVSYFDVLRYMPKPKDKAVADKPAVENKINATTPKKIAPDKTR